MDKVEISTSEAWSELKKLSEELRLLRNSRSTLAGRSDPISRRNVIQLSVSIRTKYNRHKQLRQILIDRNEIKE